jgi:hypothetical protein
MAKNSKELVYPVQDFIVKFFSSPWVGVVADGISIEEAFRRKYSPKNTKEGMEARIHTEQRKADAPNKQDMRMEVDKPTVPIEVKMPEKKEYVPPKGTRAEKIVKEIKIKTPIKITGIPKPIPPPAPKLTSNSQEYCKKLLNRVPPAVPKKKGAPVQHPPKQSYANVVANTNNVGSQDKAQRMIEMKDKFPELSTQEIMELCTPNKPQPGNASQGRKPVTNTSSLKVQVAMGVSKGPSRKAALLGFTDTVTHHMFNETNMGRIINESNRHLVFAHSQVRILSGHVLQKAVCFYLNKAPNQLEYDRVKECVFKALNIDPEGNGGMVAPQSKAHLILKGFDFFKTRYSKRPEDILTGDDVIK